MQNNIQNFNPQPLYYGYQMFIYPTPIFNQQQLIYFNPNQQFQISWQNVRTQQVDIDAKRDLSIPQQNPVPVKKNQEFKSTKKIQNQLRESQSSDRGQDSEYKMNKNSRRQKLKKKKIMKSKPKEERNIVPNLIQQVFSFLSKKSKSQSYAHKAFQTLEIPQTKTLNVQRYYIYQKKIKDRLDHCVNLETLRILNNIELPKLEEIKICFEDIEIITYQKISRILGSYFLKIISPLLTLHSRRMPQEKRIEHLSRRRIVLNKLQNLAMK